jgi:hypothetical protein
VIAIKEITVWKDTSIQSNHVYLMDGSKAIAYMPRGTGTPFYFKTGWTLDKRGRKFETLKKNPFKAVDTPAESHIIKVQGSKGETYSVNTQEHTCSCPGFTYRGTCKHVTANT